ncbi:MAG: PIG-L family deacetylase [Terriglobia bacterium]
MKSGFRKWLFRRAPCVAIGALLALAAWAAPPRSVTIQATPDARPLPIDRGAAAVWQSLLKLHTRASLIMITAHPDDEDGGMLAYESRGQGARVILLTLNRGEGGQNAMSPDYFDAMALLRTEELLAADRYYGVEQFWTRVCDFGFSKTKQQTLDEWTLDRVLYDAVRVVRMTRPLVVTSVFVGGPTDGHGNHQVAGEVAQLVYKMAGDPNVFPQQIRQGLRPWTPLKDYASVPFATHTAKGIYDYANRRYYPLRFFNYIANRWTLGLLKANVEISEGNYAPLMGLSYAQVASIGMGFQKSQFGGESIKLAGQFMKAYHRFGSRFAAPDQEPSFFAGIDTSLMGIADLAQGQDAQFLKQGLAQLNSLVGKAMSQFSALHPEAIAPFLAEGQKATGALIEQVAASRLTPAAKYDVTNELEVKQTQFNTAIAEALGLDMQATVAPPKPPAGRLARSGRTPPSFQVAIPGQTFWVRVHVANQGSVPVDVSRIWLAASQGGDWSASPEGSARGALRGDLAAGHAANVRFKVTAPENAPYTKPYFSRPNIEQPYYNILNQKYLNLPLAPYPLAAWVEFTYDGVPVRLGEDIQTVERITGPGTVFNPLVVGPAISVTISPRAGIVPLEAKSFEVRTLIHSNVKGPAQGTVQLDLPPGWKSEPATAQFSTARDGEDELLSFRVTPSQLAAKRYTLIAVAKYQGREYKEGYRMVGYEGLRPSFLYRPAVYQTQGVNVKVAPGLSVGYVVGAGDSLPQSLENLGILVHFLAPSDLAGGDLNKFDVILIGERAYSVRDDLRTYNRRLLDYVRNGGVVIVQYQSPDYNHDYGPYPYNLPDNPEVVMDIHSKVTLLDPASPVMSWPNAITAKDFDGWVEERGHGFMSSWDARYKALLSTQDPSQAPQRGGLLVARYGKGAYVYCAYAFYRELPEGVPGAYRLFANLLSLAKNPRK